MAFFQLMLKANWLEKARLEYEDEKLRSIEISKGAKVHYTLSQRIRRKRIICKQKLRSCWKKCFSCPKNTWFHKKSVMLKTEGTIENFILRSIFGFVGGIFLTYMFFVFFVFQLNFTLSSATMLCSIFGIILTIGLAFSHRVRCVVFLLLPQFFSKRGRQALMAYAFVLTLTGPAKNTLHNTGVLSESLACGQEQLKEAVKTIIDLVKRPFYALRDSIAKVIKTIKVVVNRIKKAILAIKRMVLSILRVIKAVFQWLGSIVNICNKKLGTPFERCQRAFEGAVSDCYAKLGPYFGAVCNLAYVAGAVCYIVKPMDFICMLVSFVADTIVEAVRKKIQRFTKQANAMFYVKIKFSHSFHFETNKSRTIEEVSTGVMTEIRSRTDRFLTVFDWMSFVTSFFVLFTLLRVIYYRQKWLTNERFDNKYLTKDLRQIDLIRARSDKETVLPLNQREKNKYIPLTSITLIRVEKIKLTKSAIFLCLTTFKLCIHMMADYSLYWVLSTIRYHGRFETKVQRENSVGVYVAGDGYLAELYRSVARAFSPYGDDTEIDTVPCLPDPVPPDLDRYTQIVTLIVFCWIMAIFEPYGLRLRHVVMTYYHPQRAQQRAVWLYNHILRSRGSFLKYARRQLRRKFGMNAGQPIEQITCKERMLALCPILRHCMSTDERNCLLCGTVERENKPPHVKCPTPGCIGLFCIQCFADLQNLCTICLAPMDYGDLTDMSEEKDSSDDQQAVVPKKRGVSTTEEIVREAGDDDEEKLIPESAELSRDESARANEDTGDLSSSTEYSQSYQDGEPEKFDATKQERIHYKDVEAQKPHDDVTIQIFNEPLRGDTTSGEESPTSCFVVRAHRKIRSRLKRKEESRSIGRDRSASSIADTESLPTEEIDEDEIIHIEIEDESEKGKLGAGGSNILRKKHGRVERIVDALNRVSWLNRRSDKEKPERDSGEFEARRASLTSRVRDILQANEKSKSIHKDVVESESDEPSENERSRSRTPESSSSESDYEKRALTKPSAVVCPTTCGKRREATSRKRSRSSRDYPDNYIYETSWESHRNREDDDTPRYLNKQEKDRYLRRLNAMSKGTKYSEISEINLNKLSDRKSSSETSKTEESWNITESEDKQSGALDYSPDSRDNETEAKTYSMGMSTIEEDSKELSTTDNETDNGKLSETKETDDYVDVTGFSSVTDETERDEAPKRQKSATRYVTEEGMEAVTPRAFKRAKRIKKLRRVVDRERPDLYDPLAGLEIYGVHGKTGRKRKSWMEEEETEEVDEKETENFEEESEEKNELGGEERFTEDEKRDEEKSEEMEKLDDGSADAHPEVTQLDTSTETPGPEMESPVDRKPSEDHRNYRKNGARRSKKDKGKRRKREESADKKHERIYERTDVRRASQATPEEWFYEEQRRLWEQMCAKMAEYSHRSCYPERFSRSSQYFPHDGCTIPMYDPKLFRPPIQSHKRPRFPRERTDRGGKPLPPVLKRFLPMYQRPDLVEELKARDRERLIGARNERSLKCDCGRTKSERHKDTFSRKIFSRPSNTPERTDVLPYQETESFKDLVHEYRAIAIPRAIAEISGGEDERECSDITDDREPLISMSMKADKSKEVKQLYPPEKKRPSAVSRMGSKIASVFKIDTRRRSADVDRRIADSESWSEMSLVECERMISGESPEDHTDNETTE